MIAALFVETDGCYFGLPNVDPWDDSRDARSYAGPFPVVAHPDCKRWGRFWHGSTFKPHRFKLGDDGGCFASALASVRKWGGVLEHPADSHAWRHYGLQRPQRFAGWQRADDLGWTCYVEQGHYGHMSRKPTWLYAVGVTLPELNWSKGEQRLHPVALERYGYEKARRIGIVAMVGGKDKTRIRNATPLPFRDVLIAMANTANVAATHSPLCGRSDGEGIAMIYDVQPEQLIANLRCQIEDARRATFDRIDLLRSARGIDRKHERDIWRGFQDRIAPIEREIEMIVSALVTIKTFEPITIIVERDA